MNHRFFQASCFFTFCLLWVTPHLSAATLVLDDFEAQSSLARWQGPVSLSAAYPAHGKSGLELDLSDRRSHILESASLPADWSAFEFLRFDIFNPSGRIQIGSIWLADELGLDEGALRQGQAWRGEDKIFMYKGWNHYEVVLRHTVDENGDRNLNLEKIRLLRLEFGRQGGQLYLDNFRLVAGNEDQSAVSATDPWDCRVVLNDRDAEVTLAGPSDKLDPGPEIRQSREGAVEAVARLKETADRADSAGYQTLDPRIALAVADVGLTVRSRLAWFQRPEEEKKILDYVIASCARAADLLQARLASGQPAPRLEDQEMYVPPYPHFKGLPQKVGYFRYANGDPVIVYAMHGVNQGPLMNFFAPYNHVLESYTVGGGSRFDIRSSPVYAAFQKYPDSHRVGWDGWCGHLIKDRWSMGGEKENVVICLESPRIRAAVLEYMKTKAGQWQTMPDLLYNIMAYELMYICYCDRSQQMFRDWLKDKYGSIGKVNAVWSASYASFDQLTAPPTRDAQPVPDVNRAAWYDWACFNTRRFTDYLTWVKTEMRKLDPLVPICAGGTSSMLSAANSTSGIDEEMIINEVDDVILNESGGSHIFSDLFLSLSDTRKTMVEPEMGGTVHGTLLHFLHGKSTIAKWLWSTRPNREFPEYSVSSIPLSWDISLAEVAEVLRIGLDVRRLGPEIAAFTEPQPEVAILYSKANIVQVPPNLHQAGRTPYLDALYSTWEGARFLGCRIGFVSERQVLAGKLSRIRLLVIPAAKYMLPEVTDTILAYVREGGTAVVAPESFLFDQYARQNDRLSCLGLRIKDVTLPPILGEGETVRNYDMSTTQTIVYGEVRRTIHTGEADIFRAKAVELHTAGLVQTIDPGGNEVLASFEDNSPAIVLVKNGKGRLYYLAAPLAARDYHLVFAPLAERLGLKRPVVGVDSRGQLVTVAEVRSVEQNDRYLVYASNLGPETVEFDLKGRAALGEVVDLRSLEKAPGGHVNLGPWQETIYRVQK